MSSMRPSRRRSGRGSTSTSCMSPKLGRRSRAWVRSCGFVERSPRTLPTRSAPPNSSPLSRSSFRAVLFDAGNTLVFLDYSRIATGLSHELGVPLTPEDLAVHAGDASRAMELAAGSDQERAVVYLETLVLAAGIPAERLGEVRDCLA